MADQLSRIIVRAAQVSVQDAMVAASSADESIVPGDRADASFMPAEGFQKPILDGVPYLKVARVSSYRE